MANKQPLFAPILLSEESYEYELYVVASLSGRATAQQVS